MKAVIDAQPHELEIVLVEERVQPRFAARSVTNVLRPPAKVKRIDHVPSFPPARVNMRGRRV
jgi:hypothetical protein